MATFFGIYIFLKMHVCVQGNPNINTVVVACCPRELEYGLQQNFASTFQNLEPQILFKQ